MIEIKDIPKHGPYSEIYSSGLEYCLLSEKNEPVHQFIYCKDFLQDVYYGYFNNKPISLYSFTWAPGNIPPPINELKILIKLKEDKSLIDKIRSSTRIINKIEDILGISDKTSVQKVKGYDDIVYVTASKQWLSHPTMISLWSLFIRTYINSDPAKEEVSVINNSLSQTPSFTIPGNDKNYLSKIKDIVEKILTNKLKFNYEENMEKTYKELFVKYNSNINSMHNGGIVNFHRSNLPFKEANA